MERKTDMDEKPGKTVGRRLNPPKALSTETSNIQQSNKWRSAFGGVHIPRGVYRFLTHAEADEWLWKMITRP
jgi:hypothetical protein